MPLKKDPNLGGTEADGSKSLLYCSYCYGNGQFLQPDISVDEMISFVKNKLKEMGFPGFLAGFMVRRIKNLKRWTESKS